MKRYFNVATGTESSVETDSTILSTDNRVAHFFKPLKKGEGMLIADDGLPYLYTGNFTNPILENGVVIEGETLSNILIGIKDKRTTALNLRVEKEILGGFKSSALGAEYSYKSSKEDQLNLMGAVIAGVDDYFKCGQMVNGEVKYSYKMHTVAQLKGVFDDGANTKKRLLQRVNSLKQMVYRANTVEEVEAINWEDTVIVAQAD